MDTEPVTTIGGITILPDITLNELEPSQKNIHSSYGMGWFALKENGMPVLEHNGILSTFYTNVVALQYERI